MHRESVLGVIGVDGWNGMKRIGRETTNSSSRSENKKRSK